MTNAKTKRADLPEFPAKPREVAGVLLHLLTAVADAQHAQTTTYCRAFLAAEGTDAQRRTVAAQQSASAQRALDYARAVLEAWKLQAELTREDQTR